MTDTVPLEELNYADAIAELDDILHELEDDALDVDILSDRVERAAVLIKFCRTRITAAKMQVEQIVANLDDLADEDNSDDAGDE
jgi:exodeoxyribonuclease VII small subunit